MNKTIDVVIAPDGTSRIETNGYSGTACREASRFLEQALGQVSGEQLKPEFHQVAPQENPLQQRS